ncbi:MAG: hypothetical protein CMP07_02605 [Xanthomonadales bacterium]|nr:hypothetical protein [Xanthomonadales bacterium]
MRIPTLLLAGIFFVANAHSAEVSIATANPAGTYHLVGSALDAILEERHEVSLKVLETDGSVDNLRLLAEGEAQLGIIQSDILADSAKDAAARQISDLRGLAVLFQEYTQIVVRADSAIQRPLNLVGRRIYVGAPGSGSRKNALDILSAIGMSESDYSADDSFSSVAEAIEAVRSGSLDAAITTNSRLLTADPVRSRGLRLLSLSVPEQARIKLRNPLYSFADVSNSGGGSATLMTSRAILVTNMVDPSLTLTNGFVRTILDEIDQRLELEVARRNDFNLKIHTGSLLAYGMPLELHPAAEEFFLDNHYILNLKWLALAIAVLCLMLLIAAAVHFGEYWKITIRVREAAHARFSPRSFDRLSHAINALTRNPFFLTLWILSTLLLLDIFVILQVESAYAVANDATSPFADRSLFELLIWLITFAATGYPQELFPNSLAGKVAAGAIPLIGLANVLFLLFYSNFKKTERRELEARGMRMPHLSGHVVICGWNSHGVELVRQLIAPSLDDMARRVIVIADLDDEKPFATFDFRSGYFFYYRGDSCDINLLQSACVAEAHAVIVLADERRVHNRNLRSVYTVQAVRSACGELPEGRRPRILAELFYIENASRFISAGVDKLIPLERLSYRIMLGAVINPGISGLLLKLLDSESGYAVHFRKAGNTSGLASSIVGRTFEAAHEALRKRGRQLLAIYKNTGVEHAASDLTFHEKSPYVVRPGPPAHNQDLFDTAIENDDYLVVIEGRGARDVTRADGESVGEYSNTSTLRGDESLAVVSPVFDESVLDFANMLARFSSRVLLVVETRDEDTDEGRDVRLRDRLAKNASLHLTDDFSTTFLPSVDSSCPEFAAIDRAVIIGSDRLHQSTGRTIAEDIDNPDDWAMCTAMALRSFEPLNSEQRTVHLVMEMRRHQNLELCSDLGIDQAIPTERLIRLLTKQMTFYGGLVSEFLMKLLDYSEANNVGILRKIEAGVVPDGERARISKRGGGCVLNIPKVGPCVPLALQKQRGSLKINPPLRADEDTDDVLQAKDALFVLCKPSKTDSDH